MKANDGSGNVPERDLWETPQWLYDILDAQYNLSFDCCANIDNTKTLYHSNNFEEIASLNDFIAWMNPPFSKAKEMFTHFFKVVERGVAIYRCDNLETHIWQDIILPRCSWIFIPNKRIVYEGLNGNGARFPSALIGFNVPEPRGIEGHILRGRK